MKLKLLNTRPLDGSLHISSTSDDGSISTDNWCRGYRHIASYTVRKGAINGRVEQL